MTSPALNPAVNALSPRTWLATALSATVVILLLNVAFLWRMDPFGLLRDPRGRALLHSRHERTAKYLFNFHYVPENFDALVLGNSEEAPLRLNGLLPYRFYNEAMLGADASEERLLVEKALQTGHFKVALVGISYGITRTHNLQDALDQATPHQALGSLYIYLMMLENWRYRVTDRHPTFTDGSWHFDPGKLDPDEPWALPPGLEIDPKAAEDYRDVVEDLLRHNVRVIYVVAPRWHGFHGEPPPVLVSYQQWFLSHMPSAPVIDFNSPEYDAYARNPQLMVDVEHLSDLGTETYDRLLAARVAQILGGA